MTAEEASIPVVDRLPTETVLNRVIAGLAALRGAVSYVAGRRRGRARKLMSAPPRRLDETGGVVSLWVVLMVPVSAFAAVVALAGPQRLAAESSMSEAAHDMATMAVAERYVHQDGEGQLTAFPLDCDGLSPDWSVELNGLETAERTTLADSNADPTDQAKKDAHTAALNNLGAFRAQRSRWQEACEFLEESIVRDLGNLGVDVGSLRGFYSDSLSPGACRDSSYTTKAACTGANEIWIPGLCKISEKLVVQDAVHVALAADWHDAGWAAAQVWPDGRRLGAEAIGRRARAVTAGGQNNPIVPANSCGKRLDVLDSFGRPVVLENQSPPSRQLSESSETRTPLSG